ncbi:hypothetical protein GCM10022287_21220 [Gryllotalpicola koreensis]|uniref:Glycosyltransferase RgtA/B/C/D-like domain-containing protein n=1 Tax=Gryllotalpicola koreensis TaxID=993086 RepID=A0ABP8A1E0_9MICO
MSILLSAIILAVSASVSLSLGSAPLHTADETGHFDYAYEVWHLRLPDFYSGVLIRPSWAVVPPVQWESQHPPLFYVLLAPVIGPLADDGHAYLAVIAGRAMNSLLAGLAVFAVWWSVRRVLPRRSFAADMAAVVASLTSLVILIGGTVYSDLACLVCGAFAFGLCGALAREGRSWGLIFGAAGVSALGMLSRLSFAVWLIVLLVAVLLAENRRTGFRRLLMATGDALIVGGSALAFAGWFYVRNLLVAGSITGGHSDWSSEHLGRTSATWIEVIFGSKFWIGVFAIFNGHLSRTDFGPWLLLLVPLMAAALAWSISASARRNAPSRGTLKIVGLSLLEVVLTCLFLIWAETGGGGANNRYALPLLPILAAMFGYVFSTGRVVGAAAATAWSCCEFAIDVGMVNLEEPITHVWALVLARMAIVLAAVALIAALALMWVVRYRSSKRVAARHILRRNLQPEY